MTEGGLKQKAVKGVIWSAIERFSVQGVSFVLSLIIARLVLPSEYGLIAMLGIFLAVAQAFIDSGFSQALIQKKSRTEADFSTVFYFNIAISVVVYALLFIGAPYIAGFYHEPQLETLSKWIGLSLIISGLTIVQRAKLTIKLDFKTQAKASLTSVIIGGTAGVYLAYNGYGVWALVVQALVRAGVESALLWIFAHWRPSLIFSIESFKTLFGFGSKLLASGLLHTIYLNLYSLVIGRHYSASDVGYYNRGYTLAQFPSQNITQVITRAIYPVQCQLQDDNEKLAATFIQYLRMSCFVVFPLMVWVAALAEPLIQLVLTDKWLPAAKLLSILCIAYMWYPVMSINNQMLNVKGRSDYYLQAEVVKKILAIIILVATMPFGLNILCCGLLGYNLLDMAITIYYCKRVLPTTYMEQIKNLTPIFAISVVMGCLCYFLPRYICEGALPQLVVGLVSGSASYAALSYIFKFQEIATIKSLLK